MELNRLTLTPNISVLSGGRLGDLGRDSLVDSTLNMAEEVVDYFRTENPDIEIHHDEILIEAGVKHAKALITVYPTDEENLFVVVTARELNPNITIISRAIDFTTIKKLYAAGASNVIMPDKIGGQRMAKMVAQPNVVEFLESIMLQKHHDVSLEEISCDGIAECFFEQSIGQLNVRNLTGANIIGLKTKEGKYIFNPSSKTILTSNDLIFALGTPKDISQLKEVLHGKHVKV